MVQTLAFCPTHILYMCRRWASISAPCFVGQCDTPHSGWFPELRLGVLRWRRKVSTLRLDDVLTPAILWQHLTGNTAAHKRAGSW